MATKAIVFDIQHYSIHDGMGIRTIVFLKGCPLRCRWCANPESNNAYPELLYFPNKCIRCGKCLQACENNAANLIDGAYVFNHKRCNNCLSCAESCYSGTRKISGELRTVDQVYSEIKKDYIFYESSGGGVTFSGGEPMLHFDFIKEIGGKVKADGFNNIVETCGYFPTENFHAVKNVLDLALFDIKLINKEKHLKYCGASNELILSNFKEVISHIPVIVRIPIIPNINDSPEDIKAFCNFLEPYKETLNEIHLLPYHNLGISKFDALGRQYSLNHISAPKSPHMECIKEVFSNKGFATKIGG